MKAILFGPFVGELYWECGRFAPMLSYYKFKKYKDINIKFIVFTREERFDLYGTYADILVPLRIKGDYKNKQPNCFILDGFKRADYSALANKFNTKYNKQYNIIDHIYPNIAKAAFENKNQYNKKNMIFQYQPRHKNYDLVNDYIPKDKPIVILAPRYRKGFRRNWKRWPDFYDKLAADKVLMDNFNFIICGKKGEYIPDEKKRFYDMTDIELTTNTSLIGILLVLMENSIFTFGSQSAIPNISLLYKVEVLEFGCQKSLHTKTYNVKNTPITFIDDRKYNIEVNTIYKLFQKLLMKKKEKKR